MIFTFSFITTVWYYFTFNELLNIHLLFWSQLNILSLEKSHWLCRVVRHVFSCSGHWYKRRCLMRIHWDNGRAWEQTLGLNFLFLHWKTSLMMYWCGTLIPKKKRKEENPNNNNKDNNKNPDGGIFRGYLQLRIFHA